MGRLIGSAVVCVVVLVVVVGGRSARQGSASTESREVALELVTHIEGYSARPDYFAWLVEACHEEAFKSAYVRQRSRRRDRSYLDEEKYYYNLLSGMMRQAGNDRAEHVSIALQKFRDEQLNDPELRRPQRPRSLPPR